MKRREYVLRTLWLALAIGAPLGRARAEGESEEEGETGTTAATESEVPRADEPDYTGEGPRRQDRPACAAGFLTCMECQTPNYQYEESGGAVIKATCTNCGNDNVGRFACGAQE